MQTAQRIDIWLNGAEVEAVVRAGVAIAGRHDIIVLGTDYGAPIAREAALKFKEATYLHAEGFEAGEFRHGSAAMIDASSVVLGIMDRDALRDRRPSVARGKEERCAALRHRNDDR